MLACVHTKDAVSPLDSTISNHVWFHSIALELGSAIRIATFNVIQTSVQTREGGAHAYGGRAAAFWFLLGIASVEVLSIACFCVRRTPERGSRPEHGDQSSDDAAGSSEATSTEARVENVENDAGKSGSSCQYCFTGQNSMPTPKRMDVYLDMFAPRSLSCSQRMRRISSRTGYLPIAHATTQPDYNITLQSVESTRVHH